MTEYTTSSDRQQSRGTDSETKRAVVLTSGGMNSATAAVEARERGYELYFLHTSYGQETQGKELECGKLGDGI